MEISVLISALLANLVTKFVKSDSSQKYELTEQELYGRKMGIRAMNAVFGIVALVASSWALGDPLDPTTLQGLFETLAGVVVTFTASQGTYLLGKN